MVLLCILGSDTSPDTSKPENTGRKSYNNKILFLSSWCCSVYWGRIQAQILQSLKIQVENHTITNTLPEFMVLLWGRVQTQILQRLKIQVENHTITNTLPEFMSLLWGRVQTQILQRLKIQVENHTINKILFLSSCRCSGVGSKPRYFNAWKYR